MALVIIIIHSLLVLLSSACFLSSCFVVPPNVEGHMARASAEPGMLRVNGVRRQTPGLILPGGGSRALASPHAKKLESTRGHKTECNSQKPTEGRQCRRLNCQEDSMILMGQLSDTCIRKQGGGRRL